MRMERRGTRQADQLKLMPEPCTDRVFKGYIGIDWISSASRRLRGGERMNNVMHHFHTENLRQAFRQLDGSKAVGIDQVTKVMYGKDLQTNLENLSDKISKGGWRPKPSKKVLIPKPQGGTRPLAIGCLEDKVVQTVTAKILEAIYEPVMHRHSYGFRSGKSTHQALARLYSRIRRNGKDTVVVEMDIEKFFDTMSRELLMEMLEERIRDPFFLRHLRRTLRNSILLPSGKELLDERGVPQGNPASPVLANIYLHYTLDEWFDQHWGGRGEMVRYADDAVFVFSDMETAKEFRLALEQRFVKYKLKLNEGKSGIRRFGYKDNAKDLPFLGFAFYWWAIWNQKPQLKAKTLPRQLSRCIQDFKNWIQKNRHRYKLDVLWEKAKAKIIGHYNYFGITYNLSKLNHFYFVCIKLLYKWFNRRSQKKSFTWEKFQRRLIFKPIPRPTQGAIVFDLTRGIGTKPKRKPKSRVRKLRTHGSVRSSGRQRPLFT